MDAGGAGDVMTARIDLSGQRFGRLLVTAPAPAKRHGRSAWRCLCDCGAVVTCCTTYLTSGDTRSCGCLHRDLAAARGARRKSCWPVVASAGWSSSARGGGLAAARCDGCADAIVAAHPRRSARRSCAAGRCRAAACVTSCGGPGPPSSAPNVGSRRAGRAAGSTRPSARRRTAPLPVSGAIAPMTRPADGQSRPWSS